MLALTLLTLIALCVHDAHAAFNYTFASPSPTRHAAAYTVIDVTVAPHTAPPSEAVRQFGFFFHHTPTPSASVTPTPPSIQAPVVISPNTSLPVKTPTPTPHLASARRVAVPLSNPSPAVSPYPTPTSLSVPIVTALTSPFDGHSSPSWVKRVIAIPLRMPQRHNLTHYTPPPTASAPKAERISLDVQRDLLMPPTQFDPITSVSPNPSSLLVIAPSAPVTTTTSAPEMATVRKDYPIPSFAQVVTPLPPRPSASENVIPVNVRFQKHIYASPLHMPSATPAPSREQFASEHHMHMLARSYLPGSPYETDVRVTPQPSNTRRYTVTPSVAPSAQLTNVVRTLSGRRFHSVKTDQQTVHCAYVSPSATPSLVPTKAAIHGLDTVTRRRVAVKVLSRRRFRVRNQHRRRIPLIRVENETATAPAPSPTFTPRHTKPDMDTVAPSVTPSKIPTTYGVKMMNSRRIPSVKTNVRTTPTPETTQNSSIVEKDENSSRPAYPTFGPTPSISVSDRTAQYTAVMIASSGSPSPSDVHDMFEDTGHFSAEEGKSTSLLDALISSSIEPEEYCDSVKQCMCAVFHESLMSHSLLSYCGKLDTLTSSVCEQSREAHIFFEFWRSRQGAEGMALVNECAPDIFKIW